MKYKYRNKTIKLPDGLVKDYQAMFGERESLEKFTTDALMGHFFAGVKEYHEEDELDDLIAPMSNDKVSAIVYDLMHFMVDRWWPVKFS